MMPNNALSTIPVISPFLYPDNLLLPVTISKEYGGIGLDDPSQGLQFQVWTAWTDGVNIWLSSGTYEPTIQLTGTSISEVSLAFDQNMRPFIAFVDQGIAKFWWFDTLNNEMVITLLPNGSINPRATLDDKRSLQTLLGTSDIILAYVLNNSLYFCQERDRYGVQYLLLSGGVNGLYNIGMGTGNRLIFATL